MIEVIKANLTNDFMEAKELTGRIHSKFKSVINVMFELTGVISPSVMNARLITIVTEELSGIPDSLVVGKKEFEKLSQLSLDESVVKEADNIIFATSLVCHINKNIIESGRLYFEENNIFRDRQMELYVRLGHNLHQGDRTDGFGMTYEEQYDKLSEFSMGLMNFNLPSSIESFVSNIGRGKGLTPSSDDAMVGIMAYVMGVSLSNLFEPQYNYISFTQDMINQVNLKEYTTDVSSKYIYCATEGRFTQNLQNLIRWIFNDNKEDVQKIMDRIIETGSTSGMDLLAGIRIANEVYLRNYQRKLPEREKRKGEYIHMC